MKIFRISIIRAIAAVVIGVLLLKYGEAVFKVLTVALGIMFLIAGVLSLVGWVNQRRKSAAIRAYDNGNGKVSDAQPMFPIVGLGSVLLGLILSLTQTDNYLEWAMYLLGSVLVLGALNLVMNIFAVRKMEPVSGLLWLAPLAVIIASVVAMLKGLVPAETCTTILGVTALVFGVVEVVYSVLFYGIKKRFDKTEAQVRRASEVNANAEDGEIIAAE